MIPRHRTAEEYQAEIEELRARLEEESRRLKAAVMTAHFFQRHQALWDGCTELMCKWVPPQNKQDFLSDAQRTIAAKDAANAPR